MEIVLSWLEAGIDGNDNCSWNKKRFVKTKQLLQEMKKIQKSICEMWRGCQRNANGIAAITLSQGAFNDIFRTEWTFNANRKHMNWPPEGVSADVFEQTSPMGAIPSPSLPEECRILCSSQIVEQVFVTTFIFSNVFGIVVESFYPLCIVAHSSLCNLLKCPFQWGYSS